MRNLSILLCVFVSLFLFEIVSGQTVNPTPVVIDLTPDATQTPITTPTAESPFRQDRFEPNNSADTATSIAFQTERDLTLIADDMDYFTLFVKTGQLIQADANPHDGLDTRLKLFWNGQLVAENDDRSPTEIGSTVHFLAGGDGWLIISVGKVTNANGRYELVLSLTEPTTTPTPSPTATATQTPTASPTSSPTATAFPTTTAFPTASPTTSWPTHTPQPPATQPILPVATNTAVVWPTKTPNWSSPTPTTAIVWPTHTPTWVAPAPTAVVIWPSSTPLPPTVTSAPVVVQQSIPTTVAPSSPSPLPTATPAPTVTLTPTVAISPTAIVTKTTAIPLSVQHIRQVVPDAETLTTQIRLLIYYDANNDRIPSPSEGVSNISVLAVDARGQQLAQVFTNSQGEAAFTLSSNAVARIVVPFVPGWSERVRVGENNDGIVLGLPAVRLPVFFPVQTEES